jgi:hypothetical protein
MALKWADARFASTKPVREVREAEEREETEETEETEGPDLPAVDPFPPLLPPLVPRSYAQAGGHAVAPARKPSITRPESVAVAQVLAYRWTSVRGDRTERRGNPRWHP